MINLNLYAKTSNVFNTKKHQANQRKHVLKILFFSFALVLSSSNTYSQCLPEPVINFPFNASAASIVTTGASLTATTTAPFNSANGVATTGTAFFPNPTAGGCVQVNVSAGGNTNFDFTITGDNLSLYKTFSIYFQTQRSTGTLTGNHTLTLQYSKNGGSFQTFTGSAGTVTTTYTAITATLPFGADNPTTSLVIRLNSLNLNLAASIFRVDNFQVKAIPALTNPITSGTSICNGAPATINATYSASPDFNWYPVASGGASLSTNPSYNPVNGDPTTPVAYSNTTPGAYTYYAETGLLGCSSARVPATVTVGLPVTVNPLGSPNPVCSGSNVGLNANIASGSLPYSISWSPSTFLNSTTSATPTATGITATTTYTVEVTDGCGNTTSGSVTVNVNPLPVLVINPTPVSGIICSTGNVSLNAVGASTYTWSPSTGLSATTGSTVSASPVFNTAYTVTGTDVNGCSSTQTTNVKYSSPVLVSATANPSVICPNSNSQLGSISTNAYQVASIPFGFTSPNSPTSVSLANDAMSAAVTLPFSFNFYGVSYNQIFISSNGFIQAGASSGTNNVYGQSLPNAANPNNIIGGVWADLDPASNGTVRYWKNGISPNQIFTVEYNGVKIVGTDLFGTPRATFQIQLKESNNVEVHIQSVVQPNLGGASTHTTVALKNNNGSSFTGAPARFNNGNWNVSTPEAWRFTRPGLTFDYSWTPATFLSATGIANPEAQNVTSSTTYIVTASDINACTASTTVTVTVADPVSVNPLSSPGTVCIGSNAILNANISANSLAPYSISWTPSTFLTSTTTTSPTAVGINALTTYTVNVTDNCGFTASGSVPVNVNPLPVIGVNPTPSSGIICSTGSVVLNASGANTYSWLPSFGLSSTTGDNVTASPTINTTYTVTGIDNNGCSSTQTTHVIYSTPISLATSATPFSICSNGNSQLAVNATKNYAIGQIPFGFTSPNSPTTVVLGNDAMSAAVTLPFTFSFYGSGYTQIFISSNGFIQVGTSSATNNVYGQTLPATANPNNIIGGIWADLNPSANGTVRYWTNGTAPNRTFTVEYNGVKIEGLDLLGTPRATFQIHIKESNTVEVHIQNVVQPNILPNSTNTTLAIKNNNGNSFAGATGRFNAGNWNISTPEAWRFIPPVAIAGYAWTPSTFLSSTTIFNPVAQQVSSNSTYIVTVSDAHACTASASVSLTIHDPTVVLNSTVPTSCLGQSVLLNAVSSNGFKTVSGSNNTPVTITALGTPTITSTITIGAGALESASDLTVTINLNHSYSGDLKATLSGPCGSTILFDRLGIPAVSSGNSNPFNGQYIFKISAAAVLSETGALPAGTYKPSDVNGNSHNFTGLTFPCNAISGTWTLTIQDFELLDGGTLNNWSISFNQENYSCTFSGPGSIGIPSFSGLHNSIADVNVTPAQIGVSTYTVTTTDINGCTATASANVNTNSLPLPVIFPNDTILCTGALINVVARDLDAYSNGWPAGTLFDYGFGPTLDSGFVINGPGLYMVQVYLPFALGGCSSVSNLANITYRDAPLLFLHSDSSHCFAAATGKIVAEVFLGMPPYRFVYYNSQGNIVRNITTSSATDTLLNVSAGQYSVVVYDTITGVYPPPSCFSDSVLIQVLEPLPVVVSAVPSDILCHGYSTSVAIAASGGTQPYTGTGSYSQYAGTQSYQVSDAYGCTGTTNVTLTEPVLLSGILSTNYVPCGYASGNIHSNIQGGTPPYTYHWSNEATTANLSAMPDDSYMLTVTDANGCAASISAVLTAPGPLAINGTFANPVCRGIASGTINPVIGGGASPYNFLWNNGATTASRSALGPGSYTIAVTDANGCSRTKSYTITQPLTTLIINNSKTNVRCYGLNSGAITATPSGGTAPYTYSWNTFPVQTTATITGLTAGPYTCDVTDSIGCLKSAVITVTEPMDIIVVQTQSNVTFPGGTNGTASVSVSGGTPGYTYAWNTVPAKTTAGVTGLNAGTYKCTINDSKSCPKKVSFTITEPSARLTVTEINHDNDWQVNLNPNPTSGMVMVKFNAEERESFILSVTDFTGRILFKNENQSMEGENFLMYDFTSYAKGVYFIKLESKKQSKILRLVLQ